VSRGRVYLRHILDAIGKIESYVKDVPVLKGHVRIIPRQLDSGEEADAARTDARQTRWA